MYHTRFKGSHYEMGVKFGNILKKANIKIPIKLDSFQLDYGKKSSKILKHYFPKIAQEIKGITDILNYDDEVFIAWMMCMGCCMYNLQEQNNIEVRGCTAFCFEENGKIFYGRDNDLPPFLKSTSKSVFYQPAEGNNFILNTSSFINGEEGINQYGLTVAMTFVMPKIEEIKPGINSVFIVRCLLENCKTVSDGIKMIQEIPISSSCNIILSDISGNMVVIECNPLEINIRFPEKNATGRKFIVTVNHFSSEEMKKHDASKGNGDLFSTERYLTAYNTFKSYQQIEDGVEFSKDILRGKFGFICQYKKNLNFDTIWSSVFDLNEKQIYRAEGNPKTVKYILDSRLS